MTNKSKRKGSRIEREIVHLHVGLGIPARKVPLSGACKGFKGDIQIDVAGGLIGEVKARKSGSGFTTLKRWLAESDILFLREDRAEPMVAMPWKTYERLIKNEGGAFVARDQQIK